MSNKFIGASNFIAGLFIAVFGVYVQIGLLVTVPISIAVAWVVCTSSMGLDYDIVPRAGYRGWYLTTLLMGFLVLAAIVLKTTAAPFVMIGILIALISLASIVLT